MDGGKRSDDVGGGVSLVVVTHVASCAFQYDSVPTISSAAWLRFCAIVTLPVLDAARSFLGRYALRGPVRSPRPTSLERLNTFFLEQQKGQLQYPGTSDFRR